MSPNNTPEAPMAAPLVSSNRHLRLTIAGAMLTMILAALDQNIVNTALPRIVADLGGASHLSWVVTAFLLTSTVTTPLYGKLSDMYGRKRLFYLAIAVFLIGSVLCGLAQNMLQLILFRALQGLGAGGLMPWHRPWSAMWWRPATAAATRGSSPASSPSARWPGRWWAAC